MRETRSAAILAADAVGYSHAAETNEPLALQALSNSRRLIDPLIRAHGGRIFRHAKGLAGLGHGLALEEAEDDGGTVLVGEARDGLVEVGGELFPGGVDAGEFEVHLGGLSLVVAAAGLGATLFAGAGQERRGRLWRGLRWAWLGWRLWQQQSRRR